MRTLTLLAGTLMTLLATGRAAPAAFQVALDPHDPALRCDSTVSPALTLGAPPAGTKSLAVVFWDQQPRRLTGRWVVYNLPVSTRKLPARPASAAQLSGGTVGPNALGNTGFQAPCDVGARDFYVDYYALDTAKLPLPAGASFQQIHAAIHRHKLLEAKAHLKWVVR